MDEQYSQFLKEIAGIPNDDSYWPQENPKAEHRQAAVQHRSDRLLKLHGLTARMLSPLPERSRSRFCFLSSARKNVLGSRASAAQDVAILLLETGLRLGEALALKWTDIELDAANGKKLSYLFVREGKSKNSRRHVSLTPRAQEVLVNRSLESKSEYVFANSAGDPYLVTSLDHKRLRDDLQLPNDCVIHSLRHTFFDEVR